MLRKHALKDGMWQHRRGKCRTTGGMWALRRGRCNLRLRIGGPTAGMWTPRLGSRNLMAGMRASTAGTRGLTPWMSEPGS